MTALQSRIGIVQKSEARKELMLGNIQRGKGLEILMSEANTLIRMKIRESEG